MLDSITEENFGAKKSNNDDIVDEFDAMFRNVSAVANDVESEMRAMRGF